MQKGMVTQEIMREYSLAETELKMYLESRTAPWHEQINWNGVLGLAVMAIGSALGWAAIITCVRALAR